MYQALYRKWRPKTFDDVVDQEHISETLKRQVASDRLSHAYLFVGTRGTGKTTCAKILAKAINCQSPKNGNPCNACPSCLGIDNGSILDVLELDAASNNGVDNVRALREEAVYSPADVRKRVYIVDEVHMLSGAAFNALLKILEEPPEHLVFILATTEIHKVPATIMSRCQRFTFKRILPEKIAERLKFVAGREELGLTDDATALLSRLSDGSLRDALSLLDQCAWDRSIDAERVVSAIGLPGGSETVGILKAVAGGDTAGALGILDRLYDAGKVMASALEALADLVRDILVASLLRGGGEKLLTGGFELSVLEDFKKQLSDAELMEMLNILREAMSEFTKSSGGRLQAELCLMRLCRLRSGGVSQAAVQSQNVITRDTGRTAASAPLAVSGVPKVSVEAPEAVSPPVWSDTAPPEPEPAPEERPVSTPADGAEAEPKADSAGRVEPDASEGGAADVWRSILQALRPKLDAPSSAALSDAKVMLEGRVLTIATKNIFDQSAVNDPLIKNPLLEAATAVLNMPAEVRVVVDDGSFSGVSDGGSGSAAEGPAGGNARLDEAFKNFPGFFTVEE